MDIDTFIDLAEKYANLGWVGRDAVRTFVDEGAADDEPQQNIESAREFVILLRDAGVDTYGIEEH